MLLAIFAVALPAIAGEELSAESWLDRMSHSFRELSYQGVFSYQQGELMGSFRIAHTVINGEEFERLDYLDGEPREIVRRGHSLACMHPGHQFVRFDQQKNLPESVTRSQYYQFAVTGTSRVAGREVVEISVIPVDDDRFGYSLALDRETGLLLRSSLLGPAGELIERFQFVEISIGQELPIAYFEDVKHSYNASHKQHQQQAQEAAARPRSATQYLWAVNWLPGGFTSSSTVQASGKDMHTFTDGFAVFSVFLEAVEDTNDSVEGQARLGATIAYSKALLLDNLPYRVTVVGEIPYQTAKKIAKSVTLAHR